MLDLLRDGVWQAIGAFLSVAAIALSVLIYRWQRQRRALTYQVKSAYALLKTAEELNGRLSVQVDGAPVRNIDVMFLEVQNSGNHPIARGDFDIPVSVNFEPPARIISAVIHTEEPSNLGVVLKVEERTVTMQPLLLNPGDRFTMKFLVSSDSGTFAVHGRVIGVKAIGRSKERDPYSWLALLGLVLIAASLWFAIAQTPKRPDRPPEVWYAFGVATFGYVLAAFAVLRGNAFPTLLRRLAKKMDTVRNDA